MATTGDIIWSKELESVSHFIDKYGAQLPVFIQTLPGNFRLDPTIETQVVANQVLWVNGISTERRVIAQDSVGRYMTIPLDLPIRFELCDLKRSKPMSLRDLLDKHALPTLVQFDKKHKWSFSLGTQRYKSHKFGRLRLLRSYVETFLQTNAIFNERLEIGRVTCFPSYLKLKLKVGIGLAAETADNWKQLQAKFSNAASQANFSENKGAKDILLYPAELVEQTQTNNNRNEQQTQSGGHNASDVHIHGNSARDAVKTKDSKGNGTDSSSQTEDRFLSTSNGSKKADMRRHVAQSQRGQQFGHTLSKDGQHGVNMSTSQTTNRRHVDSGQPMQYINTNGFAGQSMNRNHSFSTGSIHSNLGASSTLDRAGERVVIHGHKGTLGISTSNLVSSSKGPDVPVQQVIVARQRALERERATPTSRDQMYSGSDTDSQTTATRGPRLVYPPEGPHYPETIRTERGAITYSPSPPPISPVSTTATLSRSQGDLSHSSSFRMVDSNLVEVNRVHSPLPADADYHRRWGPVSPAHSEQHNYSSRTWQGAPRVRPSQQRQQAVIQYSSPADVASNRNAALNPNNHRHLGNGGANYYVGNNGYGSSQRAQSLDRWEQRYEPTSSSAWQRPNEQSLDMVNPLLTDFDEPDDANRYHVRSFKPSTSANKKPRNNNPIEVKVVNRRQEPQQDYQNKTGFELKDNDGSTYIYDERIMNIQSANENQRQSEATNHRKRYVDARTSNQQPRYNNVERHRRNPTKEMRSHGDNTDIVAVHDDYKPRKVIHEEPQPSTSNDFFTPAEYESPLRQSAFTNYRDLNKTESTAGGSQSKSMMREIPVDEAEPRRSFRAISIDDDNDLDLKPSYDDRIMERMIRERNVRESRLYSNSSENESNDAQLANGYNGLEKQENNAVFSNESNTNDNSDAIRDDTSVSSSGEAQEYAVATEAEKNVTQYREIAMDNNVTLETLALDDNNNKDNIPAAPPLNLPIIERSTELVKQEKSERSLLKPETNPFDGVLEEMQKSLERRRKITSEAEKNDGDSSPKSLRDMYAKRGGSKKNESVVKSSPWNKIDNNAASGSRLVFPAKTKTPSASEKLPPSRTFSEEAKSTLERAIQKKRDQSVSSIDSEATGKVTPATPSTPDPSRHRDLGLTEIRDYPMDNIDEAQRNSMHELDNLEKYLKKQAPDSGSVRSHTSSKMFSYAQDRDTKL